MFEDINDLSVNPEVGNSTKPLLCAVFYPMEYAYDHFSNTMNHMNEEEIEQINDYDNVDDLVSYLISFHDLS